MIDDDQSNKNLEADLADLVEECRSYHSDEIEEDRDDDNATDFYDLNSQYLQTNESIIPKLAIPKKT